MLDAVLQRKANWLGHLVRRNLLLLDASEGKIEETRRLGRINIEILDDTKKTRILHSGIYLP